VFASCNEITALLVHFLYPTGAKQ